ncbi:MAG TPA: GTPase RsgA, partial [Actinotalea sp.]|nr:GTPase RsgA [Actinotalea sp.]
MSAPRGEGLEPARAWLDAGSTVALVGASGVGKSTLVNSLVGEAVMPTKALGAEGKGRHTTVTRELHLAGPGAVLDTPGLRSVGLVDADGLAE